MPAAPAIAPKIPIAAAVGRSLPAKSWPKKQRPAMRRANKQESISMRSILRSQTNRDSHEGGRDRSAAVPALVLRFRQIQKLLMELLCFPVVLSGFERVHRR